MQCKFFKTASKKQYTRIFLAISLAFFVFSFFVISGIGGQANAAGPAVSGLDQTAETAYGDSDKGVITDIPSAIGKIVGTLLSFVGVIFLILMIYGGFTWMLARGNEQDVAKAKDLIIAAVIGLLIVLSAYAITTYIGLNLI